MALPSPSMGEGWVEVAAVGVRMWLGGGTASIVFPDTAEPPPHSRPLPIEGRGEDLACSRRRKAPEVERTLVLRRAVVLGLFRIGPGLDGGADLHLHVPLHARLLRSAVGFAP